MQFSESGMGLFMNKTISAEQETKQQDALQRIERHALGLLPVFRKVFLLCAIRGFTIEETAAILDISPAAVTLRLARARREIDIRLGVRQQVRVIGQFEGQAIENDD